MRRLLSFFILAMLAILAGVWHPAVARQAGDTTSSDYPRGPNAIPLLEEIWGVAAESIHPADLAERFDQGTLETFKVRLRADDTIPLADVLNPFLESLGVSHTRFYDRRHQTYYFLRSLFSTRDLDSPRLYSIGVQLDDYSRGLVSAVLEGSPAANAGLRRQDRLLKVDGVEFTSLLQWQQPAAFTAGRGVFADREANYILYLSVQELALDRTAIEGSGVSPDVVIDDGVGRDAPLTAALDHLKC